MPQDRVVNPSLSAVFKQLKFTRSKTCCLASLRTVCLNDDSCLCTIGAPWLPWGNRDVSFHLSSCLSFTAPE